MAAAASKSSAHLTAGMRAYADVLQTAAGDVPVYVTSGYRTPEEQASAMLYKLRTKGPGELRGLYGKSGRPVIEALLAAPATVESWASIIRAKGPRLSRHLWQGAFDLRTKGLTSAQLAKLRAAVTATGGRPLVEFDHLHVDLPPKYAAMSAAEGAASGAINAAAWGAKKGIALSILVAAIGVGVVAWRKRKQLQQMPGKGGEPP
jgi:hypothetical protein